MKKQVLILYYFLFVCVYALSQNEQHANICDNTKYKILIVSEYLEDRDTLFVFSKKDAIKMSAMLLDLDKCNDMLSIKDSIIAEQDFKIQNLNTKVSFYRQMLDYMKEQNTIQQKQYADVLDDRKRCQDDLNRYVRKANTYRMTTWTSIGIIIGLSLFVLIK